MIWYNALQHSTVIWMGHHWRLISLLFLWKVSQSDGVWEISWPLIDKITTILWFKVYQGLYHLMASFCMYDLMDILLLFLAVQASSSLVLGRTWVIYKVIFPSRKPILPHTFFKSSHFYFFRSYFLTESWPGAVLNILCSIYSFS